MSEKSSAVVQRISDNKIPIWNIAECRFCAGCVAVCPADALMLHSESLETFLEKCTGCGNCQKVCPTKAITMEAL